MKNNKKIIIIISISTVFAICIGLLLFYLYQISPSTKIKKSLNKEIQLLQNTISKINTSTYNYLLTAQNTSKKKKTNIKPLSTESSLVFDLDINNKANKKIKIVYDLLSNANINLTTDLDSENKYIDSEIEYKYDSSKFNVNVYIDSANIYFKSKDLLEKYICISNEDDKGTSFIINILNSGITLKEVNYLLTIVSKSISDTKISDKITSSSETLKISESVFETKKDVLTIDNELATRVVKNLLKIISKDENALKIIQKVMGSEKLTDVQKKVVELYTGLNNGIVTLLNEEQELSLSTYMTGIFSKLVMQSLDYNLNSTFNGNVTLLNVSVDDYTNNVIVTKGDTITTLKLKNTNNNYNMQLIINKNQEEVIANLSGLLSPKEIDVEYNLAKEDKQLVTGKVKYSQSFESSKKNSALSVDFDAQNINYGKGSVKLTSITKQVNNVKKQTITNSVKYSELTLNDSLLIKAKLIKKIPAMSRLLVSGE